MAAKQIPREAANVCASWIMSPNVTGLFIWNENSGGIYPDE